MIRAESLSKIYPGETGPTVALREFSLAVDRGEFVAITGESGAGKTTLLQILGCLDQPSGGHYRLDGNLVSEMDETRLAATRNRLLGFVFQTSHFIDYLDLVDNVALPGFYAGHGITPGLRERSRELLRRVGLGHRLGHLPASLSGGERQRAAIARALFNEPRLLLADEPTGNLDRHNTSQVMDLLGELHRDGLTLLLVTHAPQVADRADRLVRLDVPDPEPASVRS